ncbi:hypothetical protein B7P34_17675 [Streptosporangium nondiastaticum]|uniref:Uncharacterized protein n=1 Tax=Streptosporangium nondiastaticum TaxID=35764 RepID=A0A9X7PGT2_9ACTN|nr:hypothetical protein [Streptosporangium nondiastaticum]PSJ27414.1 hypothetical protein B7P34_17675 [Streptosporangium nondiastaticum]
MYLVHVHLRAPEGAAFPEAAGEAVRRLARPEEGIEHVVDRLRAPAGPVLGVYVLADGLHQAEARAARACGRALAEIPAFRGWTLADAEVPLVSAFWE